MWVKECLAVSVTGSYNSIASKNMLSPFHKLKWKEEHFIIILLPGLKILENIYNMYNASELWKMNIIIFHLFKDFTLTMKSRSKFKSIPSCKALNDEWHIYFTRKVLLHWNQRLIIQFIIHERNVFLDKSQRIFRIDEKTFIFYFGIYFFCIIHWTTFLHIKNEIIYTKSMNIHTSLFWYVYICYILINVHSFTHTHHFYVYNWCIFL